MSNQSLQLKMLAYPVVGKEKAITPSTGKQLEVFEAVAQVRDASGGDFGVFIRFADNTDAWGLGQIDDSATSDYIDQTAEIQAGTTIDIFTTTNNDGFLIQSPQPFNFVGLNITQADGGGATYEYTYYNGSSYASLSGISLPTAYSATGQSSIVFYSPYNWEPGTTEAVGGNANWYSVRVRATTAGAAAVQANAAWVGQMLNFGAGASAGDRLGINEVTGSVLCDPVVLQGDEGIMPYFANADANNNIRIFYKDR